MVRSGWLCLLLALLSVAITGCAVRPSPDMPVVAVSDRCERVFQRWGRSVEDEGRVDVQDWSPPGFPYLRFDRFLASFDLTGLSPAQRRDWLARAQEKADRAWHFELQGGPPEAESWLADLQRCAASAVTALSASPELWPELQQAAQVPDSYSTPAQVMGVFPLIAPIVRWRANVTMGELADRFGDESVIAGWRRYVPEQTVMAPGSTSEVYRRDSLGVPMLGEGELRALILQHAPSWRIDTRDLNDVPGVPGRAENGRLQFQPQPVVYTQLGYAYLDGVILPQLTYQIWFPARPSETALDIYAGALDGFLWRVTLDSTGRALMYDTIHPCGCYHQWLLVEDGLRPRPSVDLEAEQLWILGPVPRGFGAPVLSLSAGDHQLLAVDFSAPANARVRTQEYRLQPLDSLRGQTPSGGRLYGEGGLIAGTERPERFLLWPTGVVSAGAMRQWGHHAVSFVGRRHFDDPSLPDRYFMMPR